jgi:hypothetical protein
MADLGPWITDSPCDAPPLTYEAFAATVIAQDPAPLYALHLDLRAMTCGEAVEVVPLWKTTMTEAEVIAAVFNGYQVPPAHVPLPGSGALMAAIVAMAVFGRMWRE